MDNELQAIAAGYMNDIEKAFENCFQKCVDSGSLSQGHDPKVLANFFITLIKGMRVASRQKPREDYLRGIIDTAILVFDGNGENKDKQVD